MVARSWLLLLAWAFLVQLLAVRAFAGGLLPSPPSVVISPCRIDVNQAGVAQGGLLVTLADRVMGHALRHGLDGEPVATVQLDTHFMSAGQVGDIVEGRARMTRITRSLAFIDGTITCGDRTLVSARGVWKRLADPDGAAAAAFRQRFIRACRHEI